MRPAKSYYRSNKKLYCENLLILVYLLIIVSEFNHIRICRWRGGLQSALGKQIAGVASPVHSFLLSLGHSRQQPPNHVGERKCLKKFVVHRGRKRGTLYSAFRSLPTPRTLSKLPWWGVLRPESNRSNQLVRGMAATTNSSRARAKMISVFLVKNTILSF